MRLRDFLDAEHALASDEDSWRGVAEEVGKESGFERERLAADRGRRAKAVHAWLDRLRGSSSVGGPALPGEAMVQAYGSIGALALFLGLLVGILTTQGALWTTSGTPINVWQFLGLMVFLQIGLLLATLAVGLWAKARGQAWIGGLGRALQGTHRWLWSRKTSAAGVGFSDQSHADAMRETSRVERWIWLGFTQRFAVAFNLGAVLTFGARLFFSELQFGWSATPEVFEPTLLQDVVAVLAAPWAWALPAEWVPSESFLAATRWDVLSGSFADSSVGGNGWWRFLWMTLLVWGLLPRLVLWMYTTHARRRELARLPWNHRGYQRLFTLMQPSVPGPTGSANPTPAPPAPAPETFTSSSATRPVILWGDWANRCPASIRSGAATPFAFLGIGDAELPHAGCGKPEVDYQALTAIETAGAGARIEEVWILVEAGEAPDRRLTRFLQELRRVVGREVPLQVLPLEYRADTTDAKQASAEPWPAPSARDLEIWQRTLGRLDDHHLHVFRPHSGGMS